MFKEIQIGFTIVSEDSCQFSTAYKGITQADEILWRMPSVEVWLLLLSSGDQEEEKQRNYCDSREFNERQKGITIWPFFDRSMS